MGGILLDLDGTLVDTAPDLVAVLNEVLVEHSEIPVPYAIARNVVSNGALGLLRLGFGLGAGEAVDETLRQRFLELYAARICDNSRLFIDLSYLSDLFSQYGLRWGIVTNKPAYYTSALLDRLALTPALDCIVCGDTLPQRKPHPAPLQFAADTLGIPAERCVYIGDARGDIEAGRAAGMRTIAATYGYINALEDPRTWSADALLAHPRDLAGILNAMGIGHGTA